MKTVGERIRQAREHRGLSGEELAKKVGYKTQSGISNLENRANGRGGFMLPKIAEALDVSIDWLLEGPDTDNMSAVASYHARADYSSTDRQQQALAAKEPPGQYPVLRQKAHALLDEISDFGLTRVVAMLEDTATLHPVHPSGGAGVLVPASSQAAGDKAA